MKLKKIAGWIQQKLLSSNNKRSEAIKKNIFWALIVRVFSIGINMILVPLTINYLNPTRYGIWLTISSIIGWVAFFDIGLGNGMRNRLTEALAENDKKKAKSIVSTTFFLMSAIVATIFLLFLIANHFLNWDKILNAGIEYREELSKVVVITFFFFCIQFIFKLIGTIYMADQKPAINELIVLLGNVLSLLLIIYLKKFQAGSLLYLSIVASLSPVVILVLFLFFSFSGKYRFLTPSWSSINLSIGKNISGLGLKFFILQIAALILYQTSNIIIAQLFTPEDVTKFNIAYKYFNVASMTFIIILTPFWSAFTDAYIRKDTLWMKRNLKKLQTIYWGFNALILVMLLLSNSVYKIWIDNSVKVPFSLSLAVAIYVSFFMGMALYIYLLNGIGAVKLQTYSAILEILLNIPLSVYLGRLMGVEGVLWAMSILVLVRLIWAPIQLNRIISGKASGIWFK